MPKAFGWAADEAGCYYYRIAEPLDALERLGWANEHGKKFAGFSSGIMRPDHPALPKIARDTADKWDVVLGQRIVNLAPSVFWQLLDKAGAFNVYEIDDDLFNIDPSNHYAHEFYTKPEIRGNLLDNIRAASRVTCSTVPLAEVLSEYASDVRVCPNGVPDWMLTHTRPRLDNGLVTIGWGGSQTHAMDFQECTKMLRQLLGRRQDVEFHCIGANYAEWIGLPKDKCRFTPWVPSVEGFHRTIDYDIGIAPLRAHKFNRSKSYIKALECAALGIPVVASDVYPYRHFIEHGVTGYLVRYEHEWGRYLRELIEDPVQRAEMGAAARRLAGLYSTTALAPTWEEALTP